jgi:hypothetical protein
MHDGTVYNQLRRSYGQPVLTRMIQLYGISKL